MFAPRRRGLGLGSCIFVVGRSEKKKEDMFVLLQYKFSLLFFLLQGKWVLASTVFASAEGLSVNYETHPPLVFTRRVVLSRIIRRKTGEWRAYGAKAAHDESC